MLAGLNVNVPLLDDATTVVSGTAASPAPITAWQAVLIFLALLAVILVFSSIKKYIYRYRYKKRLVP